MGVGKRNRAAGKPNPFGLAYSREREERERLKAPTLLYTETYWDDEGDICEEHVYSDGTKIKVIK